MKKRILNTFIASLVVLSGIGSTLQNATVQAETGTMVVKFDESTGQYKTKTVTIPKLHEVTSITSDNGYVNYGINGDDLTIYVDEGNWVNREAYTDNYKYADYVTITRQQNSDTGANNFPNTTVHNSASGYSGTLTKTGSYRFLYSTPVENYAYDKLIGVTNQYQEPDYRPSSSGYWNRTNVIGDMKMVDYVWFIKENRYSSGYYPVSSSQASWATKNWTDAGGIISPEAYRYDWWDFYNNHDGDSIFTWNYRGPGSVNKDSILVDAFITEWSWTRLVNYYEQDYEGTIYKPGTSYRNYTYEYTVTVNYVTDTTPPSGYIEADITEFTNQNVTLTATATDSQSGVRRIKLPDGTYKHWDTAIYTVTENGEYTFVFEDYAGNTISRTYYVTNIDKDSPYIIIDPYSVSWTNQDVKATLEPNDSGVSGLKYWRYRISSDEGNTYGDWSPYIWNSNIKDFTFTTTGQWRIQAELTDNAGNVTTGGSGTYNIDKINPTVNFIPNGASWRNTGITANINFSDSGGSDVKRWRYRLSSDDGKTYGNWSTFTNGKSTASIPINTHGYWKIQVEVEDNAGNNPVVTSNGYYIDMVKPEANIKASETGWTNQNVVLTATGEDADSGMSYIKLPDGSTVSGDTVTYTATENGTYTFTFYDKVGNSITESYTVDGIDRVKPFIWDAKKNPDTATKGEVTISVFAGDADSGVKRIILPNGTAVYSEKAEYKVSNNGSYMFTVEDNAGNLQAYIEEVKNIDGNIPTLSGLVLYEYEPKMYQITVNTQDKDGIQSVKLNSGEQLAYNPNTSLYEINNIKLEDYTQSSIEITDKAGNSTGAISFISSPIISFEQSYDSSKISKGEVQMEMNGPNKLSYIKNGSEIACSTKPCSYTFTNNGEVIAKHSLDAKAYLKKVKVSNIDKKADSLLLEGERTKGDKNKVDLNWDLPISSSKVTCESNSDLIVKSANGQNITLDILNESYNCYVEGVYKDNPIKSNHLTIVPFFNEELEVDRSELTYREFKDNVLMEKGRSGEFYVLNARRSNFQNFDVPIPSALAE
ncbi:hypothetical protein U8V72_25645 [Priestia filamentosa]|uniref:hypothetical protein n=1 Tax=Priestia filamentosa TaxID=1402861 RepID=UPI00397A8965